MRVPCTRVRAPVCVRAYDDIVWYAHVQQTAGLGDTADGNG